MRVIKDGHQSSLQRLDVKAGQVHAVDVDLPVLQAVGGLRVEDASGHPARVVVDGVQVGRAPWEGILAPGPHLVWTRNDSLGSVPTRAVVLAGQTALLRLKSRPLGALVDVHVRPESAAVLLGDLAVGSGRWTFRLPRGRYVVRVSEPGYVPRRIDLTVDQGAGVQPVHVTLAPDRTHPRWPRAPAGHWTASLRAGVAFGSGLRSDGEAFCDGCGDSPRALGSLASLGAGFEFPFGVALEAAAGHLSLSRRFQRTLASRSGHEYHLSHRLRLSGVWFGAGGSYSTQFARSWGLVSKATFGAVLAQSADAVTGHVDSNFDSAGIAVDGVNDRPRSTPLFGLLELGAFARVDTWRLGGTLGAFALLSEGPRFTRGSATSGGTCSSASAGSAACAADSPSLDRERTYSRSVYFVPQLYLNRTF